MSLRASAEEQTPAKSRSTGDDAPPREWLGKYEAFYKPLKKPITLRLDADVIAWFKKQGRGYQTRINRALRKLMMEERKGPRG